MSNSQKQATLIALDPRSAHGVAREENAGYQFLDLPIASEAARILFPRSTLSRSDIYNRATRIDSAPTGVTVHVAELATPGSATVFYHLGAKLALKDVSLSDVFVKRTLELRADLRSEQSLFRALTRY